MQEEQNPLRYVIEQNPLRYVIAGMLSTIDFIPASSHPEEMLGMADKIIHHINISSLDNPYEVRAETPNPNRG